MPRERLLAEVWGWADASGTRTVDSHVKSLRRKLGADLIRTVHGVGYALEVTTGERRLGRRMRRSPGSATAATPARSRPVDQGEAVLVLVGSGLASLVVFWRGIGWVPPATWLDGDRGRAADVADPGARDDRPLREMTAAARAMARGDYTRRVRATSRDEVGQLAVAFNQMAADLAAADRQRRELIANVSHELRTPIIALQAVLENAVDGVDVPDQATLQTALARPSGSGGSSPSCWTCPGSTPASCRYARPSRMSTRWSPPPSARPA